MPRCVVTVDASNNTIVGASLGLQNMFGYGLSELVGQNVNILMPPAFAKQHDLYIKRFLESNVPHVINSARNVSGRRKDGKLINLKLSLSVLKLDSQTLFVGLLEYVDVKACKIESDPRGIISRCSSNVLTLLGYNKRELVGKNISCLCPEPHRSLHDSYIDHFRKTGECKVVNKVRHVSAQHASGTKIPLALEVRQGRHGFKAILNPLRNAEVMVVVGKENLVESVTESCFVLFGKSEENMIGNNFDEFFRDCKPSIAPEELMQDAKLVTADGTMVAVRLHKSSIKPEGRSYFRVIADADLPEADSASESSDKDDFWNDTSASTLGDLSVYELMGVLGDGYFGCVRLARHKLSGLSVAIKKLRKHMFEEVGMKFPPLEVQLLRKLPPHPNLMQLFDIVEAPNEIYLVQEFVNGCELFEYCAARKDIPEKDCQILFVQIVRGVSWLHKHGIAHRDLKMENILLDRTYKKVKIIDLGLGTFYEEREYCTTFCGSPDFAAPELFMRKKYSGTAVDIWAMGVILFVMLTGYIPFDCAQKVVDVNYVWPKIQISKLAKDLVSRCLEFNVRDRITMMEIRAHPFVALPFEEHSTESNDEVDLDLVEKLSRDMGISSDLCLEAIRGQACNSVHAHYKMMRMQRFVGNNSRKSSWNFSESEDVVE